MSGQPSTTTPITQSGIHSVTDAIALSPGSSGLNHSPTASHGEDTPRIASNAMAHSQPKRPRSVKSRQPQASELEAMGIKVIDYAYVADAPKAKGYHPKQYQPTPPTHKTLRREDTEPIIDPDSQESQPSQGRLPLQRRDTEPIPEHLMPGASVATNDANPMEGPSRPSVRPLDPSLLGSPSRSLRRARLSDSAGISRSIVLVSGRSPNLKVLTGFLTPNEMLDHSPTTPTTPHTTLVLRQTASIRREPSKVSPSRRTTRPRRKGESKTVGSPGPGYALRSRSAAAKAAASQPSERKRSLRSHTARQFAPITVQSNCPKPKRPRSEPQPYYAEGRPSKRRRA